MDTIDIIDSAFSLGIPDANTIISTSDSTYDYTIFIYIGAAIVVAFIAMFIYKFYANQKKQNQQLDCENGFCNMNQNPSLTIDT